MDVKVTFVGALSLIGGTMGLLTGFSILSAVEVIFYFGKFFVSLWISKGTRRGEAETVAHNTVKSGVGNSRKASEKDKKYKEDVHDSVDENIGVVKTFREQLRHFATTFGARNVEKQEDFVSRENKIGITEMKSMDNCQCVQIGRLMNEITKFGERMDILESNIDFKIGCLEEKIINIRSMSHI